MIVGCWNAIIEDGKVTIVLDQEMIVLNFPVIKWYWGNIILEKGNIGYCQAFIDYDQGDIDLDNSKINFYLVLLFKETQILNC